MVITVQMRLVGVNMKPRNHVARAQQSGAGKHTDKREKMNKKFHVIASYTNYCDVIIEAESLEDAQKIASDMDGGNFNPMNSGDDWCIECVEECE